MTVIHADLHTHTHHSDGVLTPAELLARAIEVDLRVLSVTDHDTTDAVYPLTLAAENTAVTIVPGVELSTTWEKKEIHLLGYWVDPAYEPLIEALAKIRGERFTRAEKIVDRLKDQQITLDLDAIREATPGGLIGRPHIADAMVDGGYVPDRNAAFDGYLADGMPAVSPKNFLTPQEGIALLREAGGFVSVAHPGATRILSDLETMCEWGLQGVEVWHPHHAYGVVQKLSAAADELGLVPTGGSDYHGIDGNRMVFGRFGLTEERYQALAEAPR